MDSILISTFRNFELLVYNDCSPDASLTICQNYAQQDSRIKILNSLSKGGGSKGPSFGRNAALKEAIGEYVTFADGDDWVSPIMYQTMVDAMIKYDSDIVICGHNIVYPDRIERNSKVSESIIYNRIEATRLILQDEKILSFAWDKMYKRSLWDGIEYPVGRIYEDTATTFKLFHKANRVIHIPNCLYYYRRNNESICLSPNKASVLKRGYDNFLAFYERYRFVEEHSDYQDILDLCAFKAYMMGRNAITVDVMYNDSANVDGLKNKFLGIRHLSLPMQEKIRRFLITHFFSLYKCMVWIRYKL